MKYFLPIITTFFFYTLTVKIYADVIKAASCSFADVQIAIDSAKDGDTVIVPEDSATWSSCLEFNPMPRITLQGAGKDKTIITNAVPKTGWKDSPFWIESIKGKPFRVTGFAFKGIEGTGDGDFGAISLKGTCKNFRIDNCKFDHLNTRGIRISGDVYGVVDHCTFIMDNQQGLYVSHDAYNGGSYGDGSWSSPLTLGSDSAIYIEDCEFNIIGSVNKYSIDAGGGARYVFRYCSVNNSKVGGHGTETSGRPRSLFSFEIYNNTFKDDLKWPCAINIRGGTGVIFNNTITGDYKNGVFVMNYRSSEAFDPWGKCDGSNQYDGNEDSTGYPCLDQVGRSTDSGVGTPQASEPLYEWGNTLNGNNVDITVNSYSGPDSISVYYHIKENRDYYNDTQRPGYTPFTYPHPLTQGIVNICNEQNNGLHKKVDFKLTANGKILLRTLNGITEIEIYDTKGRLLGNVPVTSRNLVIDWNYRNSSKMSNGCYIIRLKSGKEVIIRSFVLSL